MKSGIDVANTTTGTSLASGSTYPLTTTVRRYGNALVNANNGVLILPPHKGYYKVDADVTLVAGATGTLTVTLYKDGNPITGATATQAVTSGDYASFALSTLVRQTCCGESTITIVVSGSTSTTYNAKMVVTEEV